MCSDGVPTLTIYPLNALEATWPQLCPEVCVQKLEMWVLFQLQVSEMSENI